jgi:hypothetical protein
VGLVLRAVEVAGPYRWRWLLVDEHSGTALADHQVDLDPRASETEAFEDLYRFLRWRADPDRRVASEAAWVSRVGAWIGSVALGEGIGRAIVAAAPVTVRVQVPAGAEFLAFRPWELAHVGGVPLAARGEVALVYDLPGPALVSKAPVGEALRMLAVFSLPTATSALALRRERYELSRLVRRVATRSGRRVELEVAQYGVTRVKLRDLAEAGDGWDVPHLSGHGGWESSCWNGPMAPRIRCPRRSWSACCGRCGRGSSWPWSRRAVRGGHHRRDPALARSGRSGPGAGGPGSPGSRAGQPGGGGAGAGSGAGLCRGGDALPSGRRFRSRVRRCPLRPGIPPLPTVRPRGRRGGARCGGICLGPAAGRSSAPPRCFVIGGRVLDVTAIVGFSTGTSGTPRTCAQTGRRPTVSLSRPIAAS